MAIGLRTAGAVTTATSSAAQTIANPASIANGDTVYMVITTKFTSPTITFSQPIWQLVASVTDTWGGIYVYSTRYDSTHTDNTFRQVAVSATSVADGYSAFQFGLSGANTVIFDAGPVTDTSAAAATWTPTGVTTAVNDAWVISIVASADDNNLGYSADQGFTTIQSVNTTAGTDHAARAAYKAIPTAGAVTNPTYSQTTNGNDAWIGVTFSVEDDTNANAVVSNEYAEVAIVPATPQEAFVYAEFIETAISPTVPQEAFVYAEYIEVIVGLPYPDAEGFIGWGMPI
jgi:hypothetical protein